MCENKYTSSVLRVYFIMDFSENVANILTD